MAIDRFHEGERAMQQRSGTRSALEEHEDALFSGRALRGEAARFVCSLPLIAHATRNEEGWPFPSLETGPWELLDPEHVRLQTLRDAERLSRHLAGHPKVGTLAIDLRRRFRFRLNGRASMAGQSLTVGIEHAFGNCRKYLHSIETHGAASSAPALGRWRSSFDADDARILGHATHAYIATQDADGDLDAQYKGGLAGWLGVEDDRTLVWPDYPGNGFFMSLGNLQQDPRIGLLVPDGLLLQGTAEVVEADELVARFPGAERAVRFRLERVASATGLATGEAELLEVSPTFAELGVRQAVRPLP